MTGDIGEEPQERGARAQSDAAAVGDSRSGNGRARRETQVPDNVIVRVKAVFQDL